MGEYITTGDAAKLLNETFEVHVHQSTVRYWADKGLIHKINLGGRYGVDSEEMMTFFEAEIERAQRNLAKRRNTRTDE